MAIIELFFVLVCNPLLNGHQITLIIGTTLIWSLLSSPFSVFQVVVVGNPANTNALICKKYAPSIPAENFSALTRLDQNRAQAQVASRLSVAVDDVQNVVIWGNHSSTQYPDPRNASVTVNGQKQVNQLSYIYIYS